MTGAVRSLARMLARLAAAVGASDVHRSALAGWTLDPFPVVSSAHGVDNTV